MKTKKKSKTVLVVIPARGGSKGIPRKNLRILGGKPLIYYSIKNALSIEGYNVDCYVSSDDDEINLLAKKFGAKTLLRNKNISYDQTTLDPVIYDAYNHAIKTENRKYDYVITLQPTSPLLQKETIEKALFKMDEDKIDTLISGVHDVHLSWIKKDGEFFPNYNERVNRQFLPESYKETGGFVITKEKFITEYSRIGNNVQIFPLSKKESIDIDNFEDWNLCEYYLKRKKILFVVVGNSIVGTGHVYNTLSIANEILEHRIVFLVTKGSELAHSKIQEMNYEVYLQKNSNIIEDINKINPDIVVNDLLDTDRLYIEKLKSETNAKLVINFEDLGEGSELADLVINAMYPEKKMIPNHYFGARYFILRDEFLYTKQKKISITVKNVLLSFGGVDPSNFTERVLKIIFQFCEKEDIKVTIVAGIGYKHLEKIKVMYPNVAIKKNIKNISDEILKSDLVFTSAGRTTFEVASVGVPSVVLCQNQRETTHFFASQKNGFLNLGLGSNIQDKTIFEAFKSVLNYDTRLSMHQRMIENDIKKGKQRVVKLINQAILNK